MKRMDDARKEIVPLIVSVCEALTGHANENEVALLLGTAAAESSLDHRVQIGGGPARGLWQMEPGMTGAQDIFKNYLAYKPILLLKLCRLWFGLDSFPRVVGIWTPSADELAVNLEQYDDFACAMARIKYLRDSVPIPHSRENQAAYWKRVYNTPAGMGTVEHYLSQWEECRCSTLLDNHFGVPGDIETCRERLIRTSRRG